VITAAGLALAGAAAQAEDGIGAMAERGHLGARPRPVADVGPPGLRTLASGRGRDALIYAPPGLSAEKPAPLVLLLHGAGGDAKQMFPLLAELADAHGIALFLPESRGRTWDLILEDYGPDVALIDWGLGEIFARYPIDPARIAIGGFSDGASYALSLGLINGALFTHVLAFAPGFMAPTRVEDSPRFFVAHGVDDRVLPIDRTSRRVVPSLRRAGYEVEYREFPAGHVVPPEIAAAAVAWFLAD
jgi:phospholipase/carboxylesterase